MLRGFWIALGLVAVAACGGAGTPPVHPNDHSDAGPLDAGPSDAGPEFVALLEDVSNYRSWIQIVLPDGDTNLGPRTVYLNHAPPHGSTSWPKGTIIVKETLVYRGNGAVTVDVMSKRGGGFNTDDGGAPGWEWMGLDLSDDGGVSINWRGAVPPPNAGYGPSQQACNGCHLQAIANDCVQLPDDDAGIAAGQPLLLSHY